MWKTCACGNFLSLHDAIDNMEKTICEKLGCIITIHMDPIVTDDPELCKIKEIISQFLDKKYPGVLTHDFRMVRGDTHTNVIFDAVIPFEMKENEVAEALKRAVNEYNSSYFAVVNTERQYS